MENWTQRTELLIGKEGIEKLSRAHVLVAGLGGVGGYAAEQLCRAGIGKLTLIDGDTIHPTNRNRQILALVSTGGKAKTQLMSDRLRDINPAISPEIITAYLKEDEFPPILDRPFDYVVDAIDTLTPKVHLLAAAFRKGFPIVSSMGSGGRLHPEKITIADIADSHHCRFAYIVRKYLHRPEPVGKEAVREVSGEENKRSVVGTISYMPAIFGCYCASVVIRDLLGKKGL